MKLQRSVFIVKMKNNGNGVSVITFVREKFKQNVITIVLLTDISNDSNALAFSCIKHTGNLEQGQRTKVQGW